ncbi:hypothetical protein FOCC_FOCC005461 [Frankliniella occidentalis]|nr:hypothetical protein FOCC_FOCC005461 [Frankliniella occidentalis]
MTRFSFTQHSFYRRLRDLPRTDFFKNFYCPFLMKVIKEPNENVYATTKFASLPSLTLTYHMFPGGSLDLLHKTFGGGISERVVTWPRAPLQGNRGRVGTNEQPATCPKCFRVYRRRKHMVCHLRDECGKPPQFQCPYCIKALRQKSNLRAHIRNWQRWNDDFVQNPLSASTSDTLERHRCPRCQKDYRRRHHMLYHLRMECGKPPQFLCPHCSHATKQKSNLRTHMRRHHPHLLNNNQ